MKKQFSILLGMMLIANLGLFAQKTKPAPTSGPTSAEQVAGFRKVYEQALMFNDFSVATNAVYDILALGAEQNHYLDTLALLYFQRAAWPQVVAVTDKILGARPDAVGPLELRAVAYQTIGMVKESLQDYEKLYGSTQNVYHLYEIAALQYALRRFGECDASLGKLINNPDIKDKVIQLNAGKQVQEVPMPAACRNMVGVLLMEQGKREEAKSAFKDALKLFPDFVLAQNNLAEAEKP